MNEEEKDIELNTEDLDDSVVAEEEQGEQIKKLKEKLKAAEDKAKEYLDGWQRSQADFVNIRKRDEEAKKEFIKFVSSKFVSELIPVLDSCEQAIAHGHKDVLPIYSQLMKILKDNNVDEIGEVGETFDPRFHESVGIVKTDKKDDEQKVLEIMQKGYKLFEKVLRPARVRIGEFINSN